MSTLDHGEADKLADVCHATLFFHTFCCVSCLFPTMMMINAICFGFGLLLCRSARTSVVNRHKSCALPIPMSIQFCFCHWTGNESPGLVPCVQQKVRWLTSVNAIAENRLNASRKWTTNSNACRIEGYTGGIEFYACVFRIALPARAYRNYNFASHFFLSFSADWLAGLLFRAVLEITFNYLSEGDWHACGRPTVCIRCQRRTALCFCFLFLFWCMRQPFGRCNAMMHCKCNASWRYRAVAFQANGGWICRRSTAVDGKHSRYIFIAHTHTHVLERLERWWVQRRGTFNWHRTVPTNQQINNNKTSKSYALTHAYRARERALTHHSLLHHSLCALHQQYCNAIHFSSSRQTCVMCTYINMYENSIEFRVLYMHVHSLSLNPTKLDVDAFWPYIYYVLYYMLCSIDGEATTRVGVQQNIRNA